MCHTRYLLCGLILACLQVSTTSLKSPAAFTVSSSRVAKTSTSSRLEFRKMQGGASSDESSSSSSSVAAASKLNYNASSVDAGSFQISELMDQLETSAESGLTQEQVEERLRLYGKNKLDSAAKPSIWKLIAEQFDDRLVQILVVVAIISAVFSFLEHT
eukprot:CAMPEP_0113603308 /NCGR_PEP_ID=MMETSP0017_2-20120614/1209_1 /TAXON_ID=2856 /ORGANISM="Cylindrotheca closterium" /LENGTH=158 /DNA_ID=CAMNT_0000511691 /DNA_START=111 /DNA_END=584 /DNA_ORIENTATION=- /assembly_acc=CAM_ASM_000147